MATHVQVYLPEEEDTAAGDDSVFGSESETEDGSLEPTSPGSADSEDGCFKFIKVNSIKIFTDFRKKKTKPQMTRASSSKSTQSGSVSGSDASLAGSVTESLPIIIPQYYATDEYFFGYPSRGYAVIINNETFEPESDFEDRDGSLHDEDRLREIFKKLGFRVKTYKNLHGDQIGAKMSQMAERDHADKDCFACAILTHGGQARENIGGVPIVHDIVFGTDGEAISTSLLMELFNDDNCPSLTGKPRLFFIQACRGKEYDLGTEVGVYDVFPAKTGSRAAAGDVRDAQDADPPEKDEGEMLVKLSIPRYRDFLVAYATPPGYFAWRKLEGSWFIWSLHAAVMTAKLEEESLLDLLTFCSWNQAMCFETRKEDPKTKKIIEEESGRKSVPHISHMLTKEVYFRPKPRVSQ